jgi:cbb3-type cytochrome oxidase subunit 3
VRVSDVISHLRLDLFPQIALVIFLAVFAAVVIRTYARRRRDEFEHAANLPLDDSPAISARHGDTGAHKGAKP